MKTTLVAALACSFVVFSAADAFAGGWKTTFAPEQLDSYLEGEGLRLAVSADGKRPKRARYAVRALAKALRKSASVESVTLNPVGLPAGLTDDAIASKIVDKLGFTNVDRIVLVRIADDAKGLPTLATVAVLSATGEELASASTEMGIQLASFTPPKPEPQVDFEAQAAEVALVEDLARETEVEGTYEERRLKLKSSEELTPGMEPDLWPRMYEGGKRVDEYSFYNAAGREDLAVSYRRWDRFKATMWGTGGALMASGSYLLLRDTVAQDGPDSGKSATFITGLSMLATSTIPLVIAAFTNPHPVEAYEAQQLAEAHNQALRQDLGIAEADGAPVPTASR